MSEPTPTIFFVSGATRGLGSSALQAIADKFPERVRIVRYLAADQESNKEVAKEIGAKHGRVDMVIANAGICTGFAPVHELDSAQLSEHFHTNVLGPTLLFQSLFHLLKASRNPKFIPISSLGGSISLFPQNPMYNTCYCTSKAALNWVARKIHFENEWLVCFPVSPGSVDTEMLNNLNSKDTTGAVTQIMGTYGVISPEAASNAVLDIITSATRESAGGEFLHVDGTKWPW